MAEVFVVPRKGRAPRWPATAPRGLSRALLGAEGAFVPLDAYWISRLQTGDVLKVTPPRALVEGRAAAAAARAEVASRYQFRDTRDLDAAARIAAARTAVLAYADARVNDKGTATDAYNKAIAEGASPAVAEAHATLIVSQACVGRAVEADALAIAAEQALDGASPEGRKELAPRVAEVRRKAALLKGAATKAAKIAARAAEDAAAEAGAQDEEADAEEADAEAAGQDDEETDAEAAGQDDAEG